MRNEVRGERNEIRRARNEVRGLRNEVRGVCENPTGSVKVKKLFEKYTYRVALCTIILYIAPAFCRLHAMIHIY
jgi:hypothetical protein